MFGIQLVCHELMDFWFSRSWYVRTDPHNRKLGKHNLNDIYRVTFIGFGFRTERTGSKSILFVLYKFNTSRALYCPISLSISCPKSVCPLSVTIKIYHFALLLNQLFTQKFLSYPFSIKLVVFSKFINFF